MQFAVLPHTDQKQPTTLSDPSYTHHTPHTHLEFVSRACLSLSSMIFSWFCHFRFGNCYCGLSAHFFFFHADSLTRLSSWRKEKIPASSRTAAGKETKHNKSSRMLLYIGSTGNSEASPSCLPVRQPDCLFRLPTSHLTATKTNQIVTDDDLRPGLDYFSFVT